MNNRIKHLFILFLMSLFVGCAVNMFAARYYRLLESERVLFLGLRAIDSVSAMTYLDLESPSERAGFYEHFWQSERILDRTEFEARSAYAFGQYGRYAPLNDDRIQIYVRHGPPSKIDAVTPQKKLGVKIDEVVKPAEIWTYKTKGTIFDFVRVANAYKVIGQLEFGEKVKIPHLKEIPFDTTISEGKMPPLDFDVVLGRFRQKRNLTRLEVYLSLVLYDTTDVLIARKIRIFDKHDSLVSEKAGMLICQDGGQGRFFDEVNFWLAPEHYLLEIEVADIKNKRMGKKDLTVNLLDYQDDTKEISDIISAQLIDDAFTHEKFNKPVGRVIPMTNPVVKVHHPFYFYVEAYNLATDNGLHKLRTTYEVYNKTAMRREIVDVMIHDWIEPGDVAFLAAEYHPMDLDPGHYVMVVNVKDLVSAKERTSVTEFELETEK